MVFFDLSLKKFDKLNRGSSGRRIDETSGAIFREEGSIEVCPFSNCDSNPLATKGSDHSQCFSKVPIRDQNAHLLIAECRLRIAAFKFRIPHSEIRIYI